MDLDPVFLSRIQFAFLISFHIIFPAFTIGLAAWLATIEGARLATGNPLYRRVFDFWLKVFAVSFGMGVVTGIVMAFQFGTNWGVLAQKTGSIQGPLLGYEAFTAFMLEATFFGVMLLGRDRVSPRFYFFACCMVSLGTMFSSFWILANNSWMQVPLGHTIVDGKIIPADWWAIVLGPVMMVRWPHMLLAAFLTTGMCVAATGAWYVLRDVHRAEARVMLHWGLGLVAVLIPIQLFFGHLTGVYVLKHQPAKFAAIEARWKTQQPASEVLIAIPDEKQRTQSLRDRNPEARQHDRLGQLDRERDRTGDVPEGRPAAGGDPVLRLSPHGGDGTDHAGGLVVRQLPALARPARDDALVSLGNVPRVSDRLRRRPLPAGSRPRSGVSRGSSTGCCAPRTRSRRRSRPATCCSRSSATCSSTRWSISFGLYYIYKLLREGPTGEAKAIPGATGRRPMAFADSAETATGGRLHSRRVSAMEPSNLALFWAGVIACAILLYVILDGFDLGVGMLFGTTGDEAHRVADDGHDRPVLGRQRDLAGGDRRRALRGVSRSSTRCSSARSTSRCCCCCSG